MKLTQMKSLKFSLPEDPFTDRLSKLEQLSEKLKLLTQKAGIVENEKFKQALDSIRNALESGKDLVEEINLPIKIRALAVAISETEIPLTERLFRKIDSLRPTPSSLLIQNVYQYYLTYYDEMRLSDPKTVAKWLLASLSKRKLKKPFHDELLGDNGPKWLAEKAISNNREFDNQIRLVELDKYAEGRYLTSAKQIYFVEQLKSIQCNKPHDILLELQKPDTFEARYDEHHLMGHKVLEILIERAPTTEDIDESWRNVVMAIGGDPRVSKSHKKYQKWWSQIDPNLIKKVHGWLSRLDLLLFLDALKNYSDLSGNPELKRMFPSRKRFLEGMFAKRLITNTRLYLSNGAERYLRKNYKPEHLPSFSNVYGSDKSLIHVQVGDSHMIEGTHSCFLWIYQRLIPSSIVFDYNKTNVSYNSLTQGMSQHQDTPATACIKHQPINFSWQRQAIETLEHIGIQLSMRDVLTDEDYKNCKRQFGMSL